MTLLRYFHCLTLLRSRGRDTSSVADAQLCPQHSERIYNKVINSDGEIQFRRLALKSPPLVPKWGRWAKKLGCESDPPVCSLLVWEDRMRTQVFSPTYPTWALVGGTSRPSGETVKNIDIRSDSFSYIYVLHLLSLDFILSNSFVTVSSCWLVSAFLSSRSWMPSSSRRCCSPRSTRHRPASARAAATSSCSLTDCGV